MKRVLSILLVIAILLSAFSFSAFATMREVKNIVIEPIEYVEGAGEWIDSGYWDEEQGKYIQTERWMYYQTVPNSITVLFKDGGSVTGTIDEIYNKTNYWFSFYDDQQSSENPWGVGEHIVTAEFMGFTKKYTVSIVESDIESIAFKPVDYVENTGIWQSETVWDEEHNKFVEVDKWMCYDEKPRNITVTYKNGTTADYTDQDIEEKTGFRFSCVSDQSYKNQWGTGKHTITVYLGLISAQHTITIKETSVKSIEFDDVELYEGTADWLSFELWDEEQGKYVEKGWACYPCSPKSVTVTFKDGSSITGTTEEIYNKTNYWFSFYDDQSYENQWGVGEYTATAEFMGFLKEYTVTIKENPVKSIKINDIIRVKDSGSCIHAGHEDENGNYIANSWIQYPIEPESITVLFKDGNSITGTKQQIFEKTGFELEFSSDQSYNNQWDVGNHIATAEFMGCVQQYNVIVLDSTVPGAEGLRFDIKDDYAYVSFCDMNAVTANIPKTFNGYLVKRIGTCAFMGCIYLKTVNIPSSVEVIEMNAFATCVSIEQITLPENLKIIDDYAFSECISLKSIIIPDSVTSIGDYAFVRCRNLTSITIPDSLTDISDTAFAECEDLLYGGHKPSGATAPEWKALKLTNEKRIADGKMPLSTFPKLQEAAGIRAKDLIIEYRPDHTRPNGDSFYTVINDLNIKYGCAGENIAAGQWTAQEVVEDWMNSEGHRKNILSQEYKHMGVGYDEHLYMDLHKSGIYWVQNFIGGCTTTGIAVEGDALKITCDLHGDSYMPLENADTTKEGNILTVKYDGLTLFYNVETGSNTQFADVPQKAWYKKYIDFAVTHEIFSGTSNKTFAPEQDMTRAQFVQVFANISGVDTTNRKVNSGFSDVPKDKWYTAAVTWAAQNNIVNGMGGGRFEPNANVTREQMCVMLVNYIENYQKKALDVTANTSTFADDQNISKWAKAAVYKCAKSGLVNGVGNNRFDPKASATRAQGATLFTNFFKNYMK